MNRKISIENLIFGRQALKAERLLIALIMAFLALGLGFLGLSLRAGPVQAAPSTQAGVLQLTLPMTNTNTQTSVYSVTNLTTRTLSIRHEFYAGGYPEGRFVAVFTDTYLLFESKIYALNRLPNFPQNFVGEVVIISSQPITGSARTRAIAIPTPIPPPTAPGAPSPLLPPLPPLQPERVEINWTLITYLIVGIFALSGFFKGWWKEAITTFFLGILIFFLVVPSAAQWFINTINSLILRVWDLLSRWSITTPENLVQLNASSAQTWLIILLLFIGLAIFISRASLSSVPHTRGSYATYTITPIGSILGTILGALNGFLIVTLVRQYLEGSNLPGGNGLPTEIVMTSGGVITAGPSAGDIQVTNLPSFTFFNALLPWLIIVFGILMIFLLRKSWPVPWDYYKYTITSEKEKDQEKIVLVPVTVKK
jgi:hypothetical protein